MQLLASGTALADRLKIEPWKLDLFVVGLASLAANGLGFCLIAFAGHRKPKPAKPANPAPAPIHLIAVPAPAPPVPQAAITAAQRPRIATTAKTALPHAPAKPLPDEHGRLFFAAAMRKRAAARTDLEAVETAYRAWCHRIGCTPLPADEIGHQLIAQCMRLGIEGEDINGHLRLVGVELAKAA